ncbi:hypothetical protein ACWCOW_19340 [Streptomyces sp. NPDC001939]|uniref:hypothetical protein n=1 Tax=Streptomyces longhuiensis TaxID=2880933 RepID=UPI001D09D03F|nr:hypothetical protein [Streptomyces longhuiensis]UDL97742.1 hypothetical protein LGI35_05440 [Streptomyces longhuiensis]
MDSRADDGPTAPKLFEPEVSGGGQFQVAATKIVKGTMEQMREGHYSDDELGGGTPYFVFVAYTLKSGCRQLQSRPQRQRRDPRQ